MEKKVTISLEEYETLKDKVNRPIHRMGVTFNCPYCKHENKFYSHAFKLGENHEFVYCDRETGGCDKKFILQSNIITSEKFTAIPLTPTNH